MASLLYHNELSLSAQSKVIPYAADRLSQEAASVNYGFKNLKIKPSLIETIPELAEDRGLKSLVQSINQGETCFFTIGCCSELFTAEAGCYRQGYLEFSWNCTGCIQDAINYFALYFHFEKSLREKGFNQPVQFKWIIQEATFSDAEVNGFSCAIHLKTRSLSSPEQANQAWQLSLRMLESYIGTVDTLKSMPIYKPLSECSSELLS